MSRFEGRAVAVTGGASGIGEATVRRSDASSRKAPASRSPLYERTPGPRTPKRGFPASAPAVCGASRSTNQLDAYPRVRAL